MEHQNGTAPSYLDWQSSALLLCYWCFMEGVDGNDPTTQDWKSRMYP
jgi:hypothetical protein